MGIIHIHEHLKTNARKEPELISLDLGAKEYGITTIGFKSAMLFQDVENADKESERMLSGHTYATREEMAKFLWTCINTLDPDERLRQSGVIKKC